MRVVLSKKERQFLEDLLAGRLDEKEYSYHYRKMLRKRILDKRKKLTEDIALITRAEDLLDGV